MGKVIRPFCWHQNLSPGGCLPLPRGYIHVWNHEKKNWYKIRLQRDFFWNLKQMTEVTRCSCWHQNFIPKGLSAPAPGLCTYIKSWKKLYKIRLQRDFFETCSKWPKWQEVSVDIKILSPGIDCLWPVANIHLSNHEMMCIKSEVEGILFKLAANDHSDEAFLLT